MKILSFLVLPLSLLLVFPNARAQNSPSVRMENGASQLLVNGKPFLVLGGELGNSSAGTAAQANTILPRLAKLHFNTVLMPVAWNQIGASFSKRASCGAGRRRICWPGMEA